MRKVMVCIDLQSETIDIIKKELALRNWDDVEEVYFTHGFQRQFYSDNFHFAAYPPEDDYSEIEDSIKGALTPIADEIFANKTAPKISVKCIISNTPKTDLVSYAQENSVDEMIIATNVKHGFEGLFSSSFAEYMVRHAHCDVHILRTNKA